MPEHQNGFFKSVFGRLTLVAILSSIALPSLTHAQANYSQVEKRAMLEEALRMVRRLERKEKQKLPPARRHSGKWDVVLEISADRVFEGLSRDRSGPIGMSVNAVGNESFLHITKQNSGDELQSIGWHGFHIGSWRSIEGFEIVEACQARAEFALNNPNAVLAVYGSNLKRRQVILPKRTAYRHMVRSLHRKKVAEYRKWKRQIKVAKRRGNDDRVAELRANRPSVKIKRKELKALLRKALREDILRKRVYLNTRFNDPICALLDRDTYLPISDEEVESFFQQQAIALEETANSAPNEGGEAE